MRTGDFHYTASPQCTPVEAMALLADLTRQGELHPLIIAVVRETARPGALRSYTITDAMRLGPLRFRITYQADILRQDDSTLETVARQSPNVTVRNLTTVSPDGDSTRIACHVTLTAPTPLFGYAFGQARRAHTELAARIEKRLSPGGHRAE
ncbi:SRPBCC family protein [Catenuloplanes sp. NPDC051500]|uniref:SRPBCC family protein n=1 Tax=Catenuloplanes sp. NPDC051500 TaxID=3363959 RepID=UPI0037A138C4